MSVAEFGVRIEHGEEFICAKFDDGTEMRCAVPDRPNISEDPEH